MGGDGGVIPKNRRYLRGAGAGDKTGHSVSDDKRADPEVVKEERRRAVRFCAISNRPLLARGTAVVVCPYGRLYVKEAIVEALLERKKTEDARLDHIRGLKDLHDVRFHRNESAAAADTDAFPTCPVRGTELNGLVPAVVLVPGTPNVPNVVSARALKEMGEAAVAELHGPAEKRIALLPFGQELEAIKEQVMKKKKKRDKKRKHEDTKAIELHPQTEAQRQASKAESREPSSKVLKSLFTKPETLSSKEKADNLFARS